MNPTTSTPRITPQNLRSHPKNPSICKFMIQIARFDQLGSGVLNIHKYWPIYSPGSEPVFRETRHGFELLLPLPEAASDSVTAQVTGQVTAPVTPQVTPQDKSLSTSALHNIAQILGVPTPQVTPQVAKQVISILNAAQSPASGQELQQAAGLKDRVYFLKRYLDRLLAKGLIERTIPEKPTSRLQRYRLTQKGRKILSELKSE